jgi:prolipoprotein diacylglyceryltransferase
MVAKKFKKEIKKQLRVAISAAIGFIIAFSWRNFIFELTRNKLLQLSVLTNIHLIGFISSILITFVGVILILISSKILQ